MEYKFKNTSNDLTAFIECDNGFSFEIYPKCAYNLNYEKKDITFTVKYFRDFTFGLKNNIKPKSTFKGNLENKLFDKIITSIGNFIIQSVNTYSIKNYNKDSVIELKDTAFVLEQSDFSKKMKCLPIIYYFGRAEAVGSKVEIVDSAVLNRESYLDNYKTLYIIMNFKWMFFRLFRFLYQMKKHQKFSVSKNSFKKLKKAYSLKLTERNEKFKPVNNVFNKFVLSLKNKLPSKIYNKLLIYIKVRTGIVIDG